MDQEHIQKHIDQFMHDQNNRLIPEFEGYSPLEMHKILFFTFESDSPVVLKKLTPMDCVECPMYLSVKYFLDLIQKEGEIKLTAKGYLPTKIVLDIYNQKFLEEREFSSGISKLSKEADSLTVNLTRLLSELAGLIKKRNGKISLTKFGEKHASNAPKLLELLFKTMTQKFSWAFYDGYEDQQIGQFGFGFSLILMSKYGTEIRQNRFYSDRYIKAFPQFLDAVTPKYTTPQEYIGNCYSVRTFERFMDYFGLVRIEMQGNRMDRKVLVVKTKLFDKLIDVRPHKSSE